MSEQRDLGEHPRETNLSLSDEGMLLESLVLVMAHIDLGCAIFSLSGDLRWANGLAEGFLQHSVVWEGESLLLADALERLMKKEDYDRRTLLLLPRGCCERPLEALVLPHGRGYCVLLSDPEQLGEGFATALVTLYKLTQTEAEVSQWLASGSSVPEIANLFENSPHTIRTHIRNVLKKCAVNDQRALVGLLLRGIARCW